MIIEDIKFYATGRITRDSSLALAIDGLRWCKRCESIKPTSAFRKQKTGYRSCCKKCQYVHTKQKRKTPTRRYSRAKDCAKASGHQWTLTIEEYSHLITLPCYYCSGPIPETGIALDRIDNAKEYQTGNVVSCCFVCNTAKMNYFTFDEMIKYIGPAIKSAKLARNA